MNMYFDTRLEYEYDMLNELVEKEMHIRKAETLKNLSSVVHFEHQLFAKVLSYSWFDSQQDAITLADKLGLSKLDFLAIQENLEEFKEEFLNDTMLYQNNYDSILCHNF